MENNKITLWAVLAAVVVIGGAFLLVGNNTSQPTDVDTETSITTLYTNTTANVRSCPSSTCEVVGTYQPNEEIPAPSGISTFAEVPEWVAFSYVANNGSTETGYINKSVLSESQTTAAASVSAQNTYQAPTNQTPKVSDNLITNSAPCLAIAQDAARNGEIQGLGDYVVVKESHFKNSACYYELAYEYDIAGGRMTSTMIQAAPNNTIVAYCGYNHNTGATNCYDNNTNEITLSVFRLIEANLLTN